MRISDWSSDVCSSDLIALRGDQALVARFVSMAKDLDAKAAGGTELRVYWLEHANAETLLPTLQQLVGGGSDPAQKAGLPPASRSEEHTYELQSLMRISYDVFCLKKKKKQ